MQYEEGTLANYEKSYDPSWGRFKDKTYVVAGGSHDFYGGGDFYEYWGERAGPAPLRNWFSRDVGAWHLVFLNSYCDEVGGCGPGSPQYEWLRADLAASDAACTLALWHEPRFTSGSRNGEDEDVDPLLGSALRARGGSWCSSGTSTTTSDSPRWTATGSATTPSASASSSSAPAASRWAATGRTSGLRARSGTRRPTASSS